MEYQRQLSRRIHQEDLGDHTRGHDLNWPYGICPTRNHFPSHWWSNLHKLLVIRCICGPLLWLTIFPHHEGNLIWGIYLYQGILWVSGSHLGTRVCALSTILSLWDDHVINLDDTGDYNCDVCKIIFQRQECNKITCSPLQESSDANTNFYHKNSQGLHVMV